MVSCDSFIKCKPYTIYQGDEYGVNHSLNSVWRDFPNSENLSAQSVNATITIHYSLLHSSTWNHPYENLLETCGFLIKRF